MKENEKNRIISTLSNCENISDAQLYFNEICQIKPEFLKNPKNMQFLNLLLIFGNEDRLLLLDSLKQHDRCVCEFQAILGKSQPAVSHHLKLLEQMHLIRGWKKGKFTHYSLVEKTLKEFESLWTTWVSNITNWFGK